MWTSNILQDFRTLLASSLGIRVDSRDSVSLKEYRLMDEMTISFISCMMINLVDADLDLTLRDNANASTHISQIFQD